MEKTSKTNVVSSSGRNILLGLIIFLLIASLVPRISYAQAETLIAPLATAGSMGVAKAGGWLSSLLGIGDILGVVIGWVIYVINYIVVVVMGAGIAVVTFFISVFLALNTQVLSALAVQKGFEITLAIANLGFVLGIIIIAIATILRSQSYGIKQILWKLIVIAILVNFSLVIAGTVLNFADRLTYYFLDAFDPGGGGGFSKFADSLAGAFGPHRALLFLTASDVSSSTIGVGSTKQFAGAAAAGQTLGGVMKMFLNLLFPTILLILIGIVLVAFCILLLVRYVYLAILLILMPLAWISWVFPATQEYWHKWWNKFFHWTFFAPIVVFFLYLVIKTGETMSAAQGGIFTAGGNAGAYYQGGEYLSPSSGAMGGIATFLGSATNEIMKALLQMTVMLGLAVGGLFAAQALSIAGAATAMKTAQKAGTWALGAVKGKALQYGTSRFRKRVPRGPDQKERTFGESFTARAQQSTGLGRLGLGLLGRGITRLETMGGEEQVKRFEKEVGGMGVADRRAMLESTIDERKRIALIKSLTDDKVLEGTSLEKLIGGNAKAMFDKYGMENKVFHKENVEKTVGMDTATYEATRKYEAIKDKGSPEALAARKIADKASEDFWAKMKNKDLSMTQVNDFFDPGQKEFGGISDELRKVALRGIATTGADRIPGILAKMKSKVKEPFADELEKTIDQEIKTLEDASGIPFPQFVAQREKLKKVKANIRASLDYIAVGFGSEPTGGGASKPTPDAAPH